MANRKVALLVLIEGLREKMIAELLKKERAGWTGWNDRSRRGEFEERLIAHALRAIRGEPGQWVHVANFAAFLDAMDHI